MERKFKVGDRVKDIRTGRSGEIKSLTYSGYDKAHCVWVEFGFIHNGEQTFTNKSYRIDGTELDKGVCLHHIDPPAPVLTEWQEKELRRFTNTMNIVVIDMHDLKSILFEPEPPKYQPKKNEPVLASDGGCLWAGVFIGMRGDKYVCAIGGYKNAYDKVFPFNADLVGNVTARCCCQCGNWQHKSLINKQKITT